MVVGIAVGCSSSLTGGTGGGGGTHGIPATGGVSGTGGTSGACEAIVASYQVALAAAQTCGFDASGQCSGSALAELPVSGCPNSCDEVPVNDNSNLSALQHQWQAAGCQGVGACLELPCPAPSPGQCAMGEGGQAVCQRAGSDGTGGAPGDGGAGPVSCGSTICTASEFCCDPLCSVCAPIGSLCDLGCRVDAGAAAGTCASLAAQYDQAVAAAQSCTVSRSGDCAAMIHSSLSTSECGCDYVYANDATQPNAIYQIWLMAGCEPKSTCIEVACQPLEPAGSSGVCVPSDGGVLGVCQFPPIHLL